MYQDNFTRKAKCINVVDGDTIDVDIDLGFYTTIRQRLRLLRINTPEIFGEEKTDGLIAKAYVTDKLLGEEITIVTSKTDSFKRWLAEVYYLDDNENQVNINDELVAKGLAVPYMV